MEQPNQQPRRPTIHEATYRLVKKLAEQMEPVSRLAAAETNGPNETHPVDIMVRLLEQVVQGIETLHTRIENLQAHLDQRVMFKSPPQNGVG